MPRPQMEQKSHSLDTIPRKRFSAPFEAPKAGSNPAVIGKMTSVINGYGLMTHTYRDVELNAVAPIFPRQVAVGTQASKILFNHPMIFGQFVAFNDQSDPVAILIAILKAMADSAADEWRSKTPVQKLNVVMGAVQISLTSHEAIAWDAVSAIANKLTVLVKEGLEGFFGAVTWSLPSSGTGLVAIGIGVGLSTLFLGTTAYAGAALYVLDQVSTQAANALPAINLIAPPLPAAQVLGETMLAGYGLAAPAA